MLTLFVADRSAEPHHLNSPSSRKTVSRPGLSLETNKEDSQDMFGFNDNMAGPTSPGTYIKNEPEDLQFDTTRLMGHSLDMSSSFGAQQFGNQNTEAGNINPSDLMNGSFMNNPFGSQNMSSSFMQGNSNIADDELLDLGNLDDQRGPHDNFLAEPNGFTGSNTSQNPHGYTVASGNGGSVQANHHPPHNAGNFSHTQENTPMHSPFSSDFNYGQFRPMNAQNPRFSQSLNSGVMVAGMHEVKSRAKMSMERQSSNSRSPMTPKTPGLNNFHLNTPDSGSFPPSRTMMGAQIGHRHHKSLSGQWDNTPVSAHSWMDSPMSSPQGISMHPQISEIISSSSNASSLHHKMEGGIQPASLPAFQSQEAKRRRRRESHNMVERRRRDNINERIHDLSRLVPQHRLEDEKIRKHINNNGPLSPGIGGTGSSSPQATSLLAGGNGRRAAGNITQGLPLEEKDKGPNKGDILNGAVSWTRDLMWMVYQKFQQENDIMNYLQKIGADFPFDISEEEKRMRTELIDAVEKNGAANFNYSRAHGSGLRVPKHTDMIGEPLPHPISPQSLSPAAPHDGGVISAGVGHNRPQFWMSAGPQSDDHHEPFGLKEEEAYSMEI